MVQGTNDKHLCVMWIIMLTLRIGKEDNMGVMSCLGQLDLHSLSAIVFFLLVFCQQLQCQIHFNCIIYRPV